MKSSISLWYSDPLAHQASVPVAIQAWIIGQLCDLV